jgi:hypothetical protein
MRVPKNRIKEGKYTSGGELMDVSTNTPYKGYYYEMNGTQYAGKTFDPEAIKLSPIKQQNTLFNNASTAIFSLITGIASQAITSAVVSGKPINTSDKPAVIKYYARKINVQPITIKEVDENTFKSLQTDPLYQTTFVGNDQNAEQAEKQIPGIKTFLQG